MDNQLVLNKKTRINWYSAAILSILFLYVGILLPPSSINIYVKYSLYILIGVMSFFLFYLKNGSRVRWILFSIMPILMSVWLMSFLYSERGHIGILESDVENGIPFCHISIVNQLLSIPILKTFVSPSNLSGGEAAIYPMILIWFWSTILIGKGWCSWGCFYGGYDNFFSSLTKKPLIKISDDLARKLRIFPYAFLIVIAVLSLLLVTPLFCAYVCPFKTVTEFYQVTNFKTWIIFMVTVVGFFGFCIILPIFFGKRIWCTYLCPFGAFQSLTGKIFGVFRLKIDKDKCIDCRKCVNTCKVRGITEQSLLKKKFTSNCSLCGSCIESCPREAISVTVFGMKESPKKLFDRITEKLSNIKIMNKIRNIFSNLTDDLLNPMTFLYFFGLAVLVNFFSGFYFSTVNFIFKLIGGN